MGSLPTRFWIAQGFGVDDEDKVNAYDNGLYHMGLADQNMRYVSSVPPQTQLRDVLTRKGYSYIPIPDGWIENNISEFQMWQKYGQIVSDVLVPPPEKGGREAEHDWYFLMGTSWCTDVVMTEMRGDSGEYLSSGLGIGRYEKHDGTIGTFAFENHGYVDAGSCADKTIEGLVKMIEMRGHKALPRQSKQSATIDHKGFKIGTLDREIDGRQIVRHATKEQYHHRSYEMTAYVTSMVVPEGHCGVVLTACVFDPFTEIRALAPSLWR